MNTKEENQKLVKYPRTLHLPFSEGATSDDKISSILSVFNEIIVVTTKMDGENSTLYKDGFHARSLDGRNHPSRNWLKNFHSTFAHEIPDNFRICGENLYAKHSIHYKNLKSYFLVFSIWENDTCLNWNDTVQFCEMLKLETVPVLFSGKWEQTPYELHKYLQKSLDFTQDEGYVVRPEGSFQFNEFSSKVLKFVRKNHVTTSDHWTSELMIKNKLQN
jgi:hypothetical protein